MKKKLILLYFQLCVDIIGLSVYYMSNINYFTEKSKFFKEKKKFNVDQYLLR